MEFAPRPLSFYRRLYRIGMFVVTLAVVAGLADQWVAAQVTQYGHRAPADKGPRAVGLVELSAKGNKGCIIPIAIMLDGKFYDAGSYKAAPVPMALDFGVIYEGFRTGVSQGLFTITQPGQLNHEWIAEGTWITAEAAAAAAQKRKKYTTPVIEDEDKYGPPVLHRRVPKTDSDSSSKGDSGSSDKDRDKDKNKDTDQQKPASSSAPTAAAPATAPSAPDSTKTMPTPPDAAKTPAPPEPTKASADDEPVEDPSRPRLRRGKPVATARTEPYATFDVLPAPASAGAAKPEASNPSAASLPAVSSFIPAISDAHGPDPRPYTYDLKPAEEAIYRNKMLDLAAEQLRAHASAAPKEATPAGKSAGKSAAKVSKPVFDDASLRIFDLSNSNEPVLVFSARAALPVSGATGSTAEPKQITLIARTNLEGELQKLFFSQTDSRHLDVTPHMELIDAVDADGDGRGELLFRRTFEAGSAYAIYRVTADGLWTLFEGTP